MAKLQLLLLLSALVAISYGEKAVDVVPPQPPGPKPTPTVPTTPIPSPTTSTSAPITTKSTSPPITTKSTSPPITTKSTSPPTTTKPTPAPTTTKPTPAPTPEPPKPVDPSLGVWQVNYTDSNVTCLLVQFALQIEIPYETTFNKTYNAPIDVPPNANASGTCGNTTQTITIHWNPIQNVTNVVDFLILSFQENTTSKTYDLKDIKISITPENKNFPGNNETNVLNLAHGHEEFGTTVSRSYRCIKKQKLNLTDTNKKPRGYIYVSHLQFQAFHNTTNKQFTTAEECSPFDTPDIVPIAVGCSLVALIIIVLVAYLIGRRRRQARGYLSMFTETKQESDYIPMKNLSCFQ